jgi:hypothetical protein
MRLRILRSIADNSSGGRGCPMRFCSLTIALALPSWARGHGLFQLTGGSADMAIRLPPDRIVAFGDSSLRVRR